MSDIYDSDMLKTCSFILATVTLVGCSPSDADFARACKTTARIEVIDLPSWKTYLAEWEALPRPSGGDKGRGILTFTDSFVAEGKRFESGLQLADNKFARDEWKIRERKTGNVIAVARTLEWLDPHFGHKSGKNCVFEYPEYYLPFIRAGR